MLKNEKTRLKRTLALVFLFLLTLAAYFSVSFFEGEPCACITVNQSIISFLNRVEATLQQFADEHGGTYPLYDELAEILRPRYPVKLGWMTNEMSTSTRTFTFTTEERGGRAIGYAVSDDRQDYVLLGIGITDKYVRVLGFDLLAGHEFPILRAGDTPPEPSPID
jgi:hypothetical protein